MANPEQIENELRAFLEEEKNMKKEDRLKYLMSIFNKHFGLDKIDHMVNYEDFNDMLSEAKSSYAKANLPMRLSGKELGQNDVNYVLMIDSFVNYLNHQKLLKRLVKFNITR